MRRIFYSAVFLFWAVMSGLLIQSEFGELHTTGIPVPPDVIWKKAILATDPSLLAVTYHGLTNRIGSFKCIPGILEEVPDLSTNDPDADLPEGMARALAGYSLDLDGTLLLFLDPLTNHLRVSLNIKTDTNLVWQTLHLQVGLRPETWTFEADAPGQTLRVKTEGGGAVDEKTYRFAELSNPGRLLRQFGGLFMPDLFTGMLGGGADGPGSALRIEIDSRKDHRLRMGSQRFRCFRLRFSILGRYSATLYLNPQSGEILRLDLPNQVSLVNETLM
ncbi:MAG TPA: hypothetical protein DCM86_14245 [Verrucomicrobiales bacterium]|nr:hypothetical protein [Verrucomicrobiales bacterium]